MLGNLETAEKYHQVEKNKYWDYEELHKYHAPSTAYKVQTVGFASANSLSASLTLSIPELGSLLPYALCRYLLLCKVGV